MRCICPKCKGEMEPEVIISHYVCSNCGHEFSPLEAEIVYEEENIKASGYIKENIGKKINLNEVFEKYGGKIYKLKNCKVVQFNKYNYKIKVFENGTVILYYKNVNNLENVVNDFKKIKEEIEQLL